MKIQLYSMFEVSLYAANQSIGSGGVQGQRLSRCLLGSLVICAVGYVKISDSVRTSTCRSLKSTLML